MSERVCDERADTGHCACAVGCAAKQVEEMREARDRAEAAVREATRPEPVPVGADTAPHEEEWVTGQGALSGALYTKDGTWIGSFTKPERARLAAEAPKMARRLLEVVAQCSYCGGSGKAHVRNPTGFDEVSCPTCDDDRLMLKSAGVLP